MNWDTILANTELMATFLKRFHLSDIGYSTLVKEMNDDGITMDKKRLQRFIKYGYEKRVTQKAYVWLLIRHGIEIAIAVKGTARTDPENREMAHTFALTHE